VETLGTLKTEPARTRPDLLAPPVVTALGDFQEEVLVAPIDPTLADTAAFCEAYQVGLATPYVVIGSGVRHSKIALPGPALAQLPGATVLDGLAR
jgi:hypothetical protein